MILDYAEKTGKFLVKTPRDHDLINKLMKTDGLNFWTGSPQDEAVLWTDNVYAALAYADHATPAAEKLLAPFIPELRASYARTGQRKCLSPDGFELYPYQKAAIDYCLRRNNALIGDEPGLGKTPTAIVLANEMKARSVLVVTPANIRLQWQERIHQWCTMKHRFLTYPILKSSDGVHRTAEWVIISYDLMRSPEIQAAIAQRTWDLVVLDEAHYLKTPEARRTQALFGDDAVCHNAGYVLGLTGTPLPNRPSECFTLAKNLCWDAIDFMNQDEFTARYNPQMLKEYGRGKKAKIEKKGRLPELRNRLRVNFMVRRKKRDVLDQLPDIRYDVIHVQENGQVRKALDYEAENLRDIDPTDLSGSNAEILGHISTARKMMGIAIAPLAADYISEILEGGEHKVFVPAWHIDVLNILEQRLSKYNPVRVDGRTSARRKEAAVRKFQDDDTCRVFVGNIQSIGVGVDGLQNVCSRGICPEPSWTPADNDQAVGRLERIGQKHGILFEFVTAKGSLIELILQRSLEKLQDIHSSLDG